MARKKKDKARTDEITRNLKRVQRPREDIIDDPTCVVGQTSRTDEDDEDDDLKIDFDLAPPQLTVFSEVIRCRGKKKWINLTVSYEAIEGFEYEWEIIEADT
jgi:hypothetical protein